MDYFLGICTPRVWKFLGCWLEISMIFLGWGIEISMKFLGRGIEISMKFLGRGIEISMEISTAGDGNFHGSHGNFQARVFLLNRAKNKKIVKKN